MTTRYADHVIGGDHASRPVATAVPEGTTYSCTDHALEYQSDGATWSTRSTFGTAGAYTAGGTDVAVADGGTGASTASAARTNLGVGTGDSPEFAALNVGAATDTTITRTGAGEIAVEGNRVFRVGGADVPIADGGTGASTATAAFDALSPMTTAGDLIVGGASGTRTRLGVGSNGEILTLVAGTPSWEPNTGVADILDLPTAEMDDTLVLAPDGAGGVEFRAETGGGGGSGDALLVQTGGATITGLSGSADKVPSSPNADDHEFDSSTLGGAALGSPTTIDANTTRKGHLYIKRSSTSTSITGRYWTRTFSNGDTVTACQRWAHGGANTRTGLLLAAATPAACDMVGIGCSTNVGVYHDNFSGLTTYAGTPGSFLASGNQMNAQVFYRSQPIYLRWVFNTSTSIDSQWSPDGHVWFTIVAARNPGYTVGAFGLAVEPESADSYAMFDWVRVNWTP